jgi:hypothetical protein
MPFIYHPTHAIIIYHPMPAVSPHASVLEHVTMGVFVRLSTVLPRTGLGSGRRAGCMHLVVKECRHCNVAVPLRFHYRSLSSNIFARCPLLAAPVFFRFVFLFFFSFFLFFSLFFLFFFALARLFLRSLRVQISDSTPRYCFSLVCVLFTCKS